MNLFLKSLGVRVAKAITKEFVEPHGDEDTWSDATVKYYEANANNMHLYKHLMIVIFLV